VELSTELFRTKGRAAKPVVAAIVRELDRADLALLAEEKGSKPSAVKRLTERHHALARSIAGGMKPGDAAILCGYTVSRVSILQGDPAFSELLAFYREDAQRPFRDLHNRLAGIAADAVEELSVRLEEDMQTEEVKDKKISVGQLVELTKMGADRTGFGPQTTALNVNVDLAGRLEAARKRVALRKFDVIEGGKEE
jgi:hypothetical protein